MRCIFVPAMKLKQKTNIMTTETINKIRAEYILDSMNNGLSFEDAVIKSFNQINDFITSLMNNVDFNELVFNNIKK